MDEAAAACLGEHDFAAFCRRRQGATTVRELLQLDWAAGRARRGRGDLIADAFCHNMVRALVGALLAVGEGAGRRLAGRCPRRGGQGSGSPVAPPHPLCLEEVAYPDPADLAGRALATRRVRPAVPPASASRPA